MGKGFLRTSNRGAEEAKKVFKVLVMFLDALLLASCPKQRPVSSTILSRGVKPLDDRKIKRDASPFGAINQFESNGTVINAILCDSMRFNAIGR
ncbi:hypothetical protein D3C77_371510 [compost metagenome]